MIKCVIRGVYGAMAFVFKSRLITSVHGGTLFTTQAMAQDGMKQVQTSISLMDWTGEPYSTSRKPSERE